MQITIKVTANTTGGVDGVIRAAVEKVMSQVINRGFRAANELRNSALIVLANPSVSPPGSPPGVRSSHLKNHWSPVVEGGGGAGGVSIRPTIYSAAHYAGYLEHGTRKMAARPFKDKVIQTAAPAITAIYSEPYL